MNKISAVQGYLMLSGEVALSVIVREDGAIVTFAGRNVVEDVDVATAQFRTRRAITAAITRAGTAVRLGSVACIGPSGAPTAVARELVGRDDVVYSAEAFISKPGWGLNAAQAGSLLACMTAFYADGEIDG